jgi:exodeoxyribonuclease-3
MKIASWNVNGIRACHKNGFLDWINGSGCDIVLLQEVRAEAEQIPADIHGIPCFEKYWFAAQKKGYSGTGILSREPALKILSGMGRPEFDSEGRVLGAEFKDLIAISAYFPNSQEGGARIKYKVAFCEAIHEWINKLRKSGKPVVLGGDFNIAHKPIDLARPDSNEDSPGYLPEEREWMESFVQAGWVDTYRTLNPEKIQYSWWSARTRARERNVGWRIDYNVVHEKDRELIKRAEIFDSVMGSDHCPVFVELSV